MVETKKADVTVRDLILALAEYPNDCPVIFGAKIADKFDDWLDFDKMHLTRQFCNMHDKGAMRTVLAIELKE